MEHKSQEIHHVGTQKDAKLENAWQSLAYSPLGAVASPPTEYL